MKKSLNKNTLQDYLDVYLETKNKKDELEIRFATKHYNPLTKIKFDKTIEKLRNSGFEIISSNEYHLNIQTEFFDVPSSRKKISNIRTTIKGLFNIQKYCKTNTFNMDVVPSYITFMQKFYKSKYFKGKDKYYPIDYDDFEFRLNYKEEKFLKTNQPLLTNILNGWNDSKKTFRLIKRTTLKHPDLPYQIDCSIIKTSRNKRGTSILIPTYTVEESNLFKNMEHYEIELELINKEAYKYTPIILEELLKKGIQHVISGIQYSNFPVAYSELNNILKNYLKLTQSKEKYDEIKEDTHYNLKKRKSRRFFIGPGSISLEMNNIVPLKSENATKENINFPYTVTEKADGIRKLLYIAPNQRIYLIDINLEFEFTGLVCNNKDYVNTIIDGEHVMYDKNGKYINKYLCFDIYWTGDEDVRVFPFIKMENMKYDAKISKEIFRYTEMMKTLSKMDHKPITNKSIALKIESKEFYSNINVPIFQQCKTIIDKINDGMFDYETDGLIFTPINKSVGSTKNGILQNNKTWKLSFKWKPPEYNTIDFLVTTKKTTTGREFVGNIFNEGASTKTSEQISSFKTMVLNVGFDEKKHGFLNPLNDIIDDNIFEKKTDKNNYKPVPFYPTEPTPNYPIHLCNIMLKKKSQDLKMLTEDGLQEIKDKMIVEFRFDKDAEEHWQWKPIRVRYDKTADFRSSGRNFGNAYHVAQSVWRSINFPITEEIITTGNNIDTSNYDSNVYYNRKSKETNTRSLRDFHNRFVKKKLILSVASSGSNLIDMSVGKAGDIQKWIDARLSFVFGIDYSKDNIENKMDGACARYIKIRRKKRNMFDALFINGNSSMNIRNTSAAFDSKSKMIINAIMGVGTKDESKLGKGVYKHFGKVKEGFDIVSNQFSIHYFFKDNLSVNEFVRNCSENCKIGGYAIGTCYDGQKIFNRLKKKEKGGSIFHLRNEKKMWSITKLYDNEEFNPDESSLGYKIDVYQESINKSFVEYLVNFDYFTTLMINYGFVLLSKEEAIKVGLPSSIGSFSELYGLMNQEIKSRRLKKTEIGGAADMTEEEKDISFLNNYFVFKKIRDVNVPNVFNVEISKTMNVENIPLEMKSREMIKKIMAERIQKVFIKKFKKKFTLPIKN
jgi:hypothetical protein